MNNADILKGLVLFDPDTADLIDFVDAISDDTKKRQQHHTTGGDVLYTSPSNPNPHRQPQHPQRTLHTIGMTKPTTFVSIETQEWCKIVESVPQPRELLDSAYNLFHTIHSRKKQQTERLRVLALVCILHTGRTRFTQTSTEWSSDPLVLQLANENPKLVKNLMTEVTSSGTRFEFHAAAANLLSPHGLEHMPDI